MSHFEHKICCQRVKEYVDIFQRWLALLRFGFCVRLVVVGKRFLDSSITLQANIRGVNFVSIGLVPNDYGAYSISWLSIFGLHVMKTTKNMYLQEICV